MEIKNIFPTNIYYNQVINYKELNKKLKNYTYDLRKKNPKGIKKSNMNGWHSADLNHNDETVMILKEMLKYYTFDYIKIAKYNMKSIQIHNIWININTKNSVNVNHIHPGAFISGVYYVNTNKESGYLEFYNPNSLILMNEKYAKLRYAKFKPSTGIIILFPSHIYHKVASNNNLLKDDRISISFNISI